MVNVIGRTRNMQEYADHPNAIRLKMKVFKEF
jgi:hypothetical protein